MLRNKKGFIAISLIYAFFLVFLATLLAIATDYAENRILLNDVKKYTKNYLNDLAEFNPVYIEDKTYTAGEVINYAYDEWIVLEDNGDSIKVILNHSLTSEEIIRIKAELNLPSSSYSSNTIQMCLSTYSLYNGYCGYRDSTNYRLYNYGNSIVKKVLENWFSNNPTLQKAKDLNILQEMTYQDGLKNYYGQSNEYNTYVRIPNNSDTAAIKSIDSIKSIVGNKKTWFLDADATVQSSPQGKSYIKIDSDNKVDTIYYKEIRPVIIIKKG